MGLTDRLNAIVQRAFSVRSPKVPPKTPGAEYVGGNGGNKWGVIGKRRDAWQLRHFSEKDVWVRTAINRRKREIARADWSIYRIDDRNATPDPKVIKAATELFTFINDKRESLSTLLSILVEDILVLDAGVFEKEKNAGGKIIALWPIPGEEIAPDPTWDGSSPKKERYYQIRNAHVVAKYRNDELVYMMANPRSCSSIGLSPVDVLIATIEADLYGEQFEYGAMKETAPAGILFLGGGMSPEKVKAFREQWESDIAGTRDVAIIGGGGFDPESGTMSAPPTFTAFGRSARDEMRREYMKWLATKVAAAFEMDLLAFNLSEAIHKSVGGNLQAKTDEGLLGLAGTIEQYMTREVLWEIDPSHRHGFQFLNLTRRDSLAKAQERKIYMDMGCTTPNEIRVEDGKLEVPWGSVPWPAVTQAKTDDPAQPFEDKPDADPEEEEPAKPGDDGLDEDENEK